MKVDNRALNAYQRAGVTPVGAKPPPQAAGPVASSEAHTGSEAAKVTISAEARALAAGSEHFDPKKVEALKEKVDNGNYKVDAHAVARRLLDKLA